MAIKICLDAGHYGKYNRSPAVPAYYESDMNWKLHLLLKKHLEQYCIQVITTRTSQAKDKGLKERGKCSEGCALFLSIHSNATGSTRDEATDYPLVIVPIDGSGDAIGKKLADCIRDAMGTTQSGRTWSKKSDSGKDWYGVINGATSVGTPGLILEHSFHTNTRSTKWLLDDANLDKLARAEAEVIAAHYGLKKPVKTEKRTRYHLTAAVTHDSKVICDRAIRVLEDSGYKVTVVEEVYEVPVEENPTPAPVEPAKTIDQVAQEVLQGKWGNGADRKNRLTAAGYDYSAVQKRVNELSRG